MRCPQKLQNNSHTSTNVERFSPVLFGRCVWPSIPQLNRLGQTLTCPQKGITIFESIYTRPIYIYQGIDIYIYIYIILYIWKNYFRLSQHRFDIYIFWWLSLLHKTLTPMTDAENHHLPVGTFGDRNASSSGKNKKRSFEREDDMGIIANHRAVQGCALQMELFTHVQ